MYELSLEYYKKALIIEKKVFGKEHPYIAMIYNNMAVVYEYQGLNTKAIEYYEKAFQIRKKLYGEDHPSTLSLSNNISRLKNNQNMLIKAWSTIKKTNKE